MFTELSCSNIIIWYHFINDILINQPHNLIAVINPLFLMD